MLELDFSNQFDTRPKLGNARRRGGQSYVARIALKGIIEHAVAQAFGVADNDLRQANRGRAGVALARQSAMYLAHVAGGLTLTEVGHLFGRDRTTVAHACGVIEDRRDDPTFNRVLDLLEWVVVTVAARHGHRTRHIS